MKFVRLAFYTGLGVIGGAAWLGLWAATAYIINQVATHFHL